MTVLHTQLAVRRTQTVARRAFVITGQRALHFSIQIPVTIYYNFGPVHNNKK